MNVNIFWSPPGAEEVSALLGGRGLGGGRHVNANWILSQVYNLMNFITKRLSTRFESGLSSRDPTCKTKKATSHRLKGIGLGSAAIFWWRATSSTCFPVHKWYTNGVFTVGSMKAIIAGAFKSGVPFNFLWLTLHLYQHRNITVNAMSLYVIISASLW